MGYEWQELDQVAYRIIDVLVAYKKDPEALHPSSDSKPPLWHALRDLFLEYVPQYDDKATVTTTIRGNKYMSTYPSEEVAAHAAMAIVAAWNANAGSPFSRDRDSCEWRNRRGDSIVINAYPPAVSKLLDPVDPPTK